MTLTSCATPTRRPPPSSCGDSRRGWMRCASATARSAASRRTADRPAALGFFFGRDELVERPLHLLRGPTGFVEPGRGDRVLLEDVHGAALGRYFGRGDPREVVGPVPAVRGREVYVVGPDYVGVAYLPVVEEGVDEGEVPASLLDEHHVPELAAVVQDGGPTGGALRHGLDPFAPQVGFAHVVLRILGPHAGQRQEE